MLALLAIATTAVALTGCGQIICRRSDLRMPAIRLGAGLVVLLLLSLLASSLVPGSTAESVALGSLIAVAVAATGLVLRLARRHPTGPVVAPAVRFEPGATVVEAEMLLAVSEAFSQAASLAECLPEVARRLLQRAESDRITITLIDEAEEEVWIAADARGLATTQIDLEGKRFPLATWVSYDEVRRHGGPLAVSRREPGRHQRIADVMGLHGAESYLAIPGHANGGLSSIVQIMSRTEILAESAETQAIWASIARQIQFGIDTMLIMESIKRRERLESMRRRAKESLQAATNLSDAYQTAADVFREVAGVDGAAILSVAPGQPGRFVVETEWTKAPIVASPAGTVRVTADCACLQEIHILTRPEQWWRGQPGSPPAQDCCLAPAGAGAALAVPLRVEDQFLGALMLYSVRARACPVETVELAELLGGTLALVINAIQLRRRDEEFRDEQAVKLRMLAAATSREDPIEALMAVAEAGLGYAGAESIDIAFIDATTGTMVIGADCTIPEWPGVDEPGERWPILPGSIQERSYRTKQPLRFSSTDPDLGPAELADIEQYGVHAWITAPLRVGGKVVGLLQVLSRDPAAFDDSRLRFWDEIAQQIAPVITTLQVSFDNLRLSRQQRLIALINQAGATATSAEEAYERLASVGLELPEVESSLLLLWHEDDGLLEVAHEAVTDESLRRYRPRQRIRPSNWDDNGPPIKPRPPVHLYAAKPDLSATEQEFLQRIDRGQTAVFMMLEEGQVHGVMALESRSGEPFPADIIDIGGVVASTAAAVLRNLRSRDLDRRKEREQDVLVRITQAATTSASVDDLLSVVSANIRTLAGARSAEVYWFSDDHAVKTLVAADCDSEWAMANPIGTAWPIAGWPIDRALINSGAPLVILDLADPLLDDGMRADLARCGIESLACLPLIGSGQIRGYTALFSDQPMHFTSELVRATASVASQAALAIDHVRTRLEEIRVAEQRRLLLRVGQAASSSLDIDTALGEIAAASLGVASSESCVIELFEPDSGELVLSGISRVSDWVIQEELLGKRRPFGAWAIDDILREQGSLMIGSVEDARVRGLMRSDMLRYETNSILAHALVSGGLYIGAFYLFARPVDAYQAADAWLVSEIAAHIVTAVQNAQILANEHQTAAERDRLLQIAEAATRTLDLRAVLQEIASATLGLANAETCHIELLDHMRQELVTEGYEALPDWTEVSGWGVGTRASFGVWPIDRRAVESREPIFIGSIEDPLVVGRLREDMLRYGMQSILVIPLWVADACVGLLNLYSRKRNAFSNAQRTVAHTLATNAANAIQNAQTHERERARRRDQEALLAVNQAVLTVTQESIQETLETISRETMSLLGAECCEIEGIAPSLTATILMAQVLVPDWESSPSGPGLELPLSDWPTTQFVLEHQKPLILDVESPELTERERAGIFAFGAQSCLITPMVLAGNSVGIISFSSRQRHAFTSEHAQLANGFGSLAALAIDRVRTWEALAQQATIDGLTGLLNHRALMERLDHQIAIADRTGDCVSLLMIDMDRFKSINDTYGHLAGDAVLHETGRFFRHALRAADLVGRYGGDEFTAILPGTDLDHAAALRRRLMEMMPTNRITLPDGSVVIPSYSIGIAAYPTVAADRQALVGAADRSMYDAKHGGTGDKLVREIDPGREPIRLIG